MVSQLYQKYTLPTNLMDARLSGEFANLYASIGSILPFPLTIANGGTNSTTALSNHRIMISLGGKIVETSALTVATLLQADANGLPVSLALGTAYQFVGMNSGATANVYLTLAGTTSQIVVGVSGSTITLSTPQNIATGSSPTFSGMTLASFSTAGVVHNAVTTGILSSSLIVNADVSGTAAIAYSKLSLSNSIVNADIGSAAAIALTKLSRVAPTIQAFTSGTGTYTTPANTLYIKVRLVGGGGGGSGSGSATGGNGGTGVNTTFGTTLLSSGGGTGGVWEGAGGAGGTASLGGGPVGIAFAGGQGTGYTFDGTVAGLVDLVGGPGASTPFGGAGGGASQQTAGYAAIANTGSGGGGGGSGTVAASASGSGGGAAGYVEAFISSPSATYGYAVGAAGAAGTAGANGFAGGAGGSGYIIVEEYYV